MVLVSIIIPTLNEEKYISDCLESVIAQDYPKDKTEVIVVDGMSTDNTRKIVNTYTSQHSFIYLVDNPLLIVPHALNKGVNFSKGEIIIRIDAHANYPRDYVSSLIENLYKFKADNVGGICKTKPANNTNMALAISIAISHPFGVGNSLFRIGVTKVTETDTVPFGCYPRSVFKKYGLFDTQLVRNQDDEFNGRIINGNGKILIIPDIIIEYYARETLSKTAKMFYQYGKYKPLVNIKLGKPATLRQFFPVVFVTGLIVGGIISPFSTYLFHIYSAVIIVYLTASLFFSVREAVFRKKTIQIFILPIVFFTVHTSYGLGYLSGIASILSKRINFNKYDLKT